MRCPNMIADEEGRLRALSDYGLSAEVGLPSLDPIVEIAARMFDTPAAAVNMIGSDHVFLVANKGVGDDVDRSRDVSFCAHAITQDDVLVVEDARLDPRFHDNPIVSAGQICFYAGVALRSPSGHSLGALCVVDNKPRAEFSEQDRARLKDLGRLASNQLELRRLEVATKAAPSRFEASAATSPNAVICFDPQSRITAWNDAAAAMFGYDAGQMTGQLLDLLVAPEDRVRVQSGIERVRSGGAPQNVASELTGVRRSGERFPAELYWSRWYEGDQMHFGAIVRDMTDQRRERDALFHLANYDSLTGLPNRNLLHQQASGAMRDGSAVALLIVDLDGFKDVNDTLGHAAGDLVLQAVTRRLVQAAPAQSIVARTGGDEFAILLRDGGDPLQLGGLARAIIATIAAPIVADGHELRIAGSCGLAIAPDHGETIEALMSSANLALFQAKSGGRGRSFLFIPALRAEAVARRMYEAELHRAVERDEFRLFYQPQIRLHDGALAGAEALIRWKHPVRGLLAPAAFLPALESGTLAGQVGSWVIRTACAQAAQWRRLQSDFRMSVNLFGAQFRGDSLLQVVRDALAANRLPPDALELEITENIILDQQDTVLDQLRSLRQLGVELSFDDFGTGFASLNLLKSYPVSLIKIDKSFTQAVQHSEGDRAIVLSILDLARKLGLDVVAEGVETREDCAFLREHGCQKGQGYYFGKPVPPAVFGDQFWPAPVAIRAR
ncbi:putative bifunctional diguanylate cyclase/phosphodiesterase [Sphingobium nicotianae]|uniref:putative bifunctional diguanylate cyclase/phosphodiesterase n=1 Tax=Sphingobium nicotianae TaxID=2782607 RepID=UPI0032D8D700